jgi:VanZ family protein
MKILRTYNRNFIYYWLPVIIWMGIIFGMSTGMFSSDHTSRFIVPLLNFFFPRLSPEEIQLLHGLIRRAGHVTEYFILGILLFRAFRGDSPYPWRPRWTLCAIIAVVVYAMSDEFHQAFVATRTASLVDVSIDSAGGIFSQVAVMLRHLLRRKKGELPSDEADGFRIQGVKDSSDSE